MITRLWERRQSNAKSIAASVAIHVAGIAALATVTFSYPLTELFDRPEPVKAIPVRYITLEPRPVAPAAGMPRRPQAAPAPAPVVPSSASTPVGAPAPAVPVAPTAPSGSAIGAGGNAASGRDPGIGFGIRPGIPDGRLANARSTARAPETETQKAERALATIYEEYLDSARTAMANPQRKPGDWSWGGKNGDKWGWDDKGIHIGGITIPNIVLAALPIPVTGNTEPVNARARDFVRSDIQYHAGPMSHDEFKAAVQRVRERVDRERRERMEKAAQKKKEPPCCG